MTIRPTPANLRTIAQHGEDACLKALYENEAVGNGANTIGGGDTRLGDNPINAGRYLTAKRNDEIRIECEKPVPYGC